MSKSGRVLLTMFLAAGLLAWLSTPPDPGRQARIKGGPDVANGPMSSELARARLACKICCPEIPELNIVPFEAVIANQPAKIKNIDAGNRPPAE
jgi:hypothetical protein